MRKTVWLLGTFLIGLTGCGGLYPSRPNSALDPAPVYSQDISALPAFEVDEGGLPFLQLSTADGNPQNEPQGEPTVKSESQPPSAAQFSETPRLVLVQGPPEIHGETSEEPLFVAFLSPETVRNEVSSAEPSVCSAKSEKESGRADPFLLPAKKTKTEKGERTFLKKRSPDAGEKNLPTEVSLQKETWVRAEEPGSEPVSPPEIQVSSPEPQPARESEERSASPSNANSKSLSSIPPLLNDKVKLFIDFFQTKADAFFSRSLARSKAYEPMMKGIFREKNLPEELFYLALIESGFNPNAFSRAKACGIWQFMTQTAKRFGLKVDKWVDERRDPEKSTYAAAEYLKNLYEMFNCWFLATASYNAGEGRIIQAMKRAQSQDFWEIANQRYLKQETKEYVPMMLAAMTIAQDPQKYGFVNVAYLPPLSYEKVSVPPGTRLEKVARAAETGVDEIRALNPSLRRDITPPDGKRFEIKIPEGRRQVFETNFYKINKLESSRGKRHVVRRGDTLAAIGRKYRVTVSELCEMNHLSSKTPLKPGVKLLVSQ